MNAEEMNRISRAVLDCAFEIHTDLGRGMLESVYKAILAQLLMDLGFCVEREKAIPIRYKGRRYPGAYRADLAVNEALIVEVKCHSMLLAVDSKQLLTHLRLSGWRLGLLINFGSASLKDGIKRIVNDFEDPKPPSIPR